VQKGWLKHVTIYLNKPIDSLPVRPIGFLQAHSSIRKELHSEQITINQENTKYEYRNSKQIQKYQLQTPNLK
jgi:hypothetical protein